jgi:hypothetical protein
MAELAARSNPHPRALRPRTQTDHKSDRPPCSSPLTATCRALLPSLPFLPLTRYTLARLPAAWGRAERPAGFRSPAKRWLSSALPEYRSPIIISGLAGNGRGGARRFRLHKPNLGPRPRPSTRPSPHADVAKADTSQRAQRRRRPGERRATYPGAEGPGPSRPTMLPAGTGVALPGQAEPSSFDTRRCRPGGGTLAGKSSAKPDKTRLVQASPVLPTHAVPAQPSRKSPGEFS